MSSYRYPDNRNGRDRSPPYRDRRPSAFGGGYPPRANDSARPNQDSASFPPRDVPRGPKSLSDAPRGPAPGGSSGTPTTPRDGRGRGFPGRGEPTPLRDAPPLSSGPAPPMTNTHNSWRADRDRDRDFDRDRRERRPTPPPRRSPIRDLRDPRDQRDFPPRDLDVSRPRRNSRDGPPSAGSTFSDPPMLGTGSSYRGSGIGRGRGGRDFGGRGRPFHNDDRDRHHDPRDRPPDRSYRPRSRSPLRRDRDMRDDRDFDRRDRDDRRFPREYDSYIGPAGAAKPGPRALDTHRGPGPSDSRHVPGTPTGPAPHSSHHASPADRLGAQTDSYSRRSSVAVDPSTNKDSRRDPGKDDLLLASRAEASRERYAPRPSSPPAAVPAFGSNDWRNPTPDVKPNMAAAPSPSKQVQVSNAAPVVPVGPPVASMAAPAPVVHSAPVPPPAPTSAPVPAPPVVPAPASAPILSPAPSTTVPPAAAAPPTQTAIKSSTAPSPVAPPTGPKADRMPDRIASDRPSMEHPAQDNRSGHIQQRMDPPPSAPLAGPPALSSVSETDRSTTQAPVSRAMSTPQYPARQGPPPSAPSAFAAKSPPQGPAPRPRPPPTAPQAALRANVSPSFSRAPLPSYAPRDTNSNMVPLPPSGPRNASGDAAANTSPKSLPVNIPTGPKADRTPMAPRPAAPYVPSERPGFNAPRAPMGGGPKSMQWVRPGLIPNRPSVPTKREFPADDRERSFGTIPKAPKLELGSSASTIHPQRVQQAQFGAPSFFRSSSDIDRPKGRAASAERSFTSSLKPGMIESRRHSDVFMAETSPRQVQPPISAASSAPHALQDSDEDLDLDEGDFAESEAKYNRQKASLEAKLVDLSAPHLRATTPLQEIILLSCLSAKHLPAPYEDDEQGAVKSEDTSRVQDVAAVSPVPATAVSQSLEPLTPRAEDTEDSTTEKREDRSIAPATIALRLRREVSKDAEVLPDLSGLPYLGSGPPTPLSDIEQERPGLPDTLKSDMLKLYQKTVQPELTETETLQQYAVRYREWRRSIRQWDEEREQDEQERQPSAEPSLKATTPDVQSSTTGALLDVPGPTGRRSHASRWATELDLEAVIKESLKTAEEERMGKQDGEPKRSMADPEREADLPLELSDAEAKRRYFIDTNFQREPGQGIFAFHYEPPEDDFTTEEHRVMVANYRDQYAKKWGKLAEILYKECGTERTYKDCINHYYATKWAREYKGKLKRGRAGKKRGGGAARGRGAIANMERPEVTGEDGLPLPVTETGRPRRSAAPTFGGMEADFDPNATIPANGRVRRQTDADGNLEKASRRSKVTREKGKKAKNPALVSAPIGSPIKLDKKDKAPVFKAEDEFAKRQIVEMPVSIHMSQHEDQMQDSAIAALRGGHVELPTLSGPIPMGLLDRQKTQPNARPGPSSYWSVSELQDFEKNVAHFGTDWIGFANHMGTKTHIMIKNQYLRMVEGGKSELEQAAKDADSRRERGDDLGPPPTPTPAPKRRYESTQSVLPRNLAPAEQAQSPLISSVSLPRNSSPPAALPARFLPQSSGQGKPLVPSTSGYSPLQETALASVPSIPQHHSPPVTVSRSQPQHHLQHNMSQHKPHHQPPRAGYFSDDLQSRLESRAASQSTPHHPLRMQQHGTPHMRSGEQHSQPSFRGLSHQERENLVRSEMQQEHEHRYQQQQQLQHARRISQEMHHQRAFPPGGPPPLMPPVRSNSIVRSPEHRPLSYSHSRQASQASASVKPPSELMAQAHGVFAGAQQMPSRGSISTPPVKEEPRYAPPSAVPQAQQTPILQSQHQARPSFSQPPAQSVPPAKHTPAPRKSNLLSLLNDPEPEEPARKKPAEPGPASHNTTPSQPTPVAPPPVSQPSTSRRDVYGDPASTQPSYGRPSYASHSSMRSSTPSRSIDLTGEQVSVNRHSHRDGWQQRQQFLPAHNQGQQAASLPTSHPGMAQPGYNDSRLFGNHRSVFAQHNTQRHNPSPPPLAAYNNSPHMHSRTPSVSAAQGQPSHAGMPGPSTAQHAQATSAVSSQILQPNPYAQVDPPGAGAPPSAPMGMRPSPHLRTSHAAQPRDGPSRNEHAQSQNAGLTYSNPPTPNEHPGHASMRGPGGMAESYRARDPRDLHHDLESRNSDRDTGRELSQRTEYLREQLANQHLRSASVQEDLRYQSQQQDRGYMTQRSHTPLSKNEAGQQPPPLQHPPHSSLGANNHPLYGQRLSEEPSRFSQSFPRDRGIADRIRQESAQQQQAALNREEQMRREGQMRDQEMREQEMRDRELRERDAHFRENLMRGNIGQYGRAPPPEQRQQQPPAGPGGHMDWANGGGRPVQRDGWQR